MKTRLRIGFSFAALILPATTLGQATNTWRESTFIRTPRGEWTGPRLPDGQPDVQGFWSNTIGNHSNLTDPQGPFEGDASPRNNNNALRDGPRGERAPSRISDPPDGQMPLQPWARAKQQELLKYLNNPIRQEYVEPFALCAPGGPTKSFLWRGYDIRQYPGYVLFLFDTGNRLIYLDGRPHVAESLKFWNGDSRGHWEGNTLVVDTTNNNSKARFGRSGEFVSENATIQELFTFDPNGERFTYDATYTDPTVLTRPFTISIPNKRVTAETPKDDWNNETFDAKHAGRETIIEAYERTCVEGNGNHGHVALEEKTL